MGGPLTDVSAAGRNGKYEELGEDLNAYVVGPARSNIAVIMCSDIFGFDTGRTMEHCGTIAERCNCIVVCPDFFHGQAPRLESSPGGCWGMLTTIPCRLPRMISLIKNTRWEGIRVDLMKQVPFSVPEA